MEWKLTSSGMMPTIRAVLSNLLPAEDANSIDIIANEVKYTDAEKKGDEWEIVYRHPESHYGHDKSKAILPYKDLEDRPTLFFCGDGVSGTSLSPFFAGLRPLVIWHWL
jgi:2-hydroxy-3-keto-5-methylthiopentenyl-1-phosphate phosphatase